MFIYVTSPIKKIIGLTRVTDQMIVRDEIHRPFSVSLDWEIGPKEQGISLESVGPAFTRRGLLSSSKQPNF